MSKAFRNTLLAISLTYIVLGLIQILWPVGSRMVICYIMGAALTLFGIYHIVRYFSADTSYMFPGMGLALGVACTVTGILMIICAKAIVAIFGVVLGICLAAGSTAAVVISAVVMAVAMLFLAAIEVNYSAALYTVLTLVAAACGLSSGVIQFRISEALCILGVLTPAAIPGVTLGCMISNLLTGGAVWDVVFGTLASLVGMLVLRTLRKHPYIAPLPYVAANMIVVPLVLRYVYAAEGTIPYFVLTVGIGEVVCAWVLGVLLLLALRRSKADKLFEDKKHA